MCVCLCVSVSRIKGLGWIRGSQSLWNTDIAPVVDSSQHCVALDLPVKEKRATNAYKHPSILP